MLASAPWVSNRTPRVLAALRKPFNNATRRPMQVNSTRRFLLDAFLSVRVPGVEPMVVYLLSFSWRQDPKATISAFVGRGHQPQLGEPRGDCYLAPTMEAFIISIGEELTTGQLLDTNSAWLSESLTRLGIRVTEQVTIGDDVERIASAIRRGMEQADVVMATGGLGPTPDDLTRAALASALDQPLEENADALDRIRAMFERWQRPFDAANRVQALIPKGCRPIPNLRGTAPGILCDGQDAAVFVLPGVPGEMKAMFSAEVLPVISRDVGETRTSQDSVLSYGISEAKIGTMLGDLMERGRNPTVGTAASHGVIAIRVIATGVSGEDAECKVKTDISEIEGRLGDAVFGREGDSLETAVAGLLESRGLTIATAESCTGGSLTKRLTDTPGSSAYLLRGYVTYANESKTELLGVPAEMIQAYGAVSEAVAGAMASGCRTAAGADLALSITGIAGPTGGDPPDKPVGLVYLGLADADHVDVRRVLLGEHLDRHEARERAASAALNLLRLFLVRSAPARR